VIEPSIALSCARADTPKRPADKLPLTPIRTIRARCLGDCRAGSTRDVRDCKCTDCPLHEYRLGRRPRKGSARRTPVQALRAYCLWCCVGQPAEVKLCPAKACPCWPFRLGRRPKPLVPATSALASESGSYEASFPRYEPVSGASS
jgi:hypothetical protein